MAYRIASHLYDLNAASPAEALRLAMQIAREGYPVRVTGPQGTMTLDEFRALVEVDETNA